MQTRALLVLSLLASCARAPRLGSPLPSRSAAGSLSAPDQAPTPATAASPTSEPGPADPCAAHGFLDDQPREVEGRYAFCLLAPDQTFAWILTSEVTQPSPEAQSWQLTRVDAHTESARLEVSAWQAPDLHPDDPNDSSHRPIVSYLSDYDADGRPELLFLQEAGQYDPGFAGVVVASSDPPRVLYAPPRGYFIDEAQDVDADGRQDLLLHFIVGGDHDVACGSYYPAEWSPDLVAHARPDGSFSLADEGARDAARAWCPRRPARPVTPEQILCALLWGTPRAALEAQLRPPLVACELEQRARAPHTDGCDPDECDHERERLSLCRFSPPLRLTATRSR